MAPKEHSDPRVDVFMAGDVVFLEIVAGLDIDGLGGSLPELARRWMPPIGYGRIRSVRSILPSSVTSATPFTTTQCSARLLWLCRLSLAPGLTVSRLARKRSPRSMSW
jgi:hypothetical protein